MEGRGLRNSKDTVYVDEHVSIIKTVISKKGKTNMFVTVRLKSEENI